ncbi:MAG TPA: hypothetical protein VKR06_43970 [Ktedonosporobacter sp.]|nr:hypothetical protein [Ktedonosporobacter sp.]
MHNQHHLPERPYSDQSDFRPAFLALLCICIAIPGISLVGGFLVPHLAAAYQHQAQALPQVGLSATAPPTIAAGQSITYTLTVATNETAGPISTLLPGSPSVQLLGAIGAGTKNLHVDGGTSWNCSASVSPATNMTSLVNCVYQGSLPIPAGQSLPPITVTTQTIAGVTPDPLNSQFLTYTDWDASSPRINGRSRAGDPEPNVVRMSTIVTGGQNSDSFATLTLQQSHDGGDTFAIGQSTIYHFTIKNTSSLDFTGGTALFPLHNNPPYAIALYADLPPGMDFSIRKIPAGWSCASQSSSVLQCLWRTYPIRAGASLPSVDISATFNSIAATSAYAPWYVTTAVLFQNMPSLTGSIATNQVQVLDQAFTPPALTPTLIAALIPTSTPTPSPRPGAIHPAPKRQSHAAQATPTMAPPTPSPTIQPIIRTAVPPTPSAPVKPTLTASPTLSATITITPAHTPKPKKTSTPPPWPSTTTTTPSTSTTLPVLPFPTVRPSPNRRA